MFKVHTNWTLTARKVEKEEQRHFQIHSSFSKFPKGFALNMGSFGAVYQRKGWSTKCEYDLFPNCRQNFLDLSFLKNIHGKIFATYCTWEVKITFKKVFRACLTFIWICSRTFGEHVFMWLHSTHHPYGPPSQATFIIHTILSLPQNWIIITVSIIKLIIILEFSNSIMTISPRSIDQRNNKETFSDSERHSCQRY